MTRTVVPTNQFKRDIKKQSIELTTPQWIEVMNCLINNMQLPVRFCNHALTGDKKLSIRSMASISVSLMVVKYVRHELLPFCN